MQQTFNVQGMTCQHCVRTVTRAVAALEPQARVEVDLDGGRVTIDSNLSRDQLAQAIREEGYTVAA